MAEDIFKDIYKLTKSSDFNSALSLIYNFKTGRIKSSYGQDLNHAWYVVGDIFYKLKDYGEALSAFKKSYKHCRSDEEAAWAIANCHSILGDLKLAKMYFQKAKDMGAPEDEVNYNLGNVYFDLNKFDKAIELYELVSQDNKELYHLTKKNRKLAKAMLAR